MSIAETLMPRGRGKSAKTELTPVQEALATPLPDELEPALLAVEEARRAFNAVSELLEQARSAAAKTAVDDELAQAQAALQRAYAKRDVAERLGSDDVPDDDEIERLVADVEVAQAQAEGFSPRIKALHNERERRRQILDDADSAARIAISKWEESLRAADETQIEHAAKLYGEAIAVWGARNRHTYITPLSLLPGPGGKTFPIPRSATLPEAVRRAYDILERASNEVTRT